MEAKEIEIYYSGHTTISDTIDSPDKAHKMLMKFWDKQINYRESVYVLYLNNKNKVKFYQKHSSGGTTHTIMDIKQIFATALKTASHAFIVAHNHPSGDLTASSADKQMRDKLESAGDVIGIKCLDFLIVSENDYNSI